MSHHTQAGRQLTTGSLAVAMVPAMVISAGLTALMAAKAYDSASKCERKSIRRESEASK